MAGDLRYKDMWWQQWERLWRPRVHHHHSSPGCWFHEMGGTSKAQICDLIKKKKASCDARGTLCMQAGAQKLDHFVARTHRPSSIESVPLKYGTASGGGGGHVWQWWQHCQAQRYKQTHPYLQEGRNPRSGLKLC
jgi:hypothetical protein